MLVLSVPGATARAQLIAYEGFDYSTGASISGSAGGTGWSGAWTNVRPINGTVYSGSGTTSASGMTYSGVTSSGGAAQLTGESHPAASTGDIQLYRTLSSTRGTPDTTTWLSFTGQRQDDPASARFFNLAIVNVTSSAPEMASFGATSDSSSMWSLKISNDAPTASAVSINDSALILVRMDHFVGAHSIWVWINPDLSGGEPSTASATFFDDTSGAYIFNTIKIGAGRSTGEATGAAMGLFDEIRVAGDYASVVGTAIPESSTYGLVAGTAALLFLVVNRRRRQHRSGT